MLRPGNATISLQCSPGALEPLRGSGAGDQLRCRQAERRFDLCLGQGQAAVAGRLAQTARDYRRQLVP